MSALQDPTIIAKLPEAQCICLTNLSYLEDCYGITFPPGELAEQFAFELQRPALDCFKFHAIRNLALVLSTPHLRLNSDAGYMGLLLILYSVK